MSDLKNAPTLESVSADLGVLMMDMLHIKDDMATLKKAIGEEGEDQYGKPTGTGLTGRIMRVEGQRDTWVHKLAGIAMAFGLLGPVLWLLVKELLAKLK